MTIYVVRRTVQENSQRQPLRERRWEVKKGGVVISTGYTTREGAERDAEMWNDLEDL